MSTHAPDASAASMIAEDLRQRLLRLELYPGSPLREADLAQRYSASRHTVRAAIAQLTSEGVLVHDRHRGARVREFDATDIDDAFDLREALEIQAVRLICRRRPPLAGVRAAVEHLDRLEATERSNATAFASWETLEADRAAHRTMVDATGSGRLIRAYESIETEVSYCYALYRVASMPPDDYDHRVILDALDHADESAALARLIPHIDAAREACLSAARPAS